MDNILKKLRNDRNLTQRELAKLLNLSPSTIAMYETGKRTPDYDILETIADFFNVSTDYLLGRTNKNIIKVDTVEKAERLSDEIIQLLIRTDQITKEEAKNGIEDEVKRQRILKKIEKAIKFAQEIDEL